MVYTFSIHRKSYLQKNTYSGTVVKCQQNDWGRNFYTIQTAWGGKKLLCMYKLSHAVHVCSHAVFFDLIHQEFIDMV